MTSFTVADIGAAVGRAHAAMRDLEQVLNEADAQLGDGDTGSMLARVFDRLAAVNLTDSNDVGGAFKALASAGAGATGSSLGTLFVAALMMIGKETKGAKSVEWSRLSGLLASARDAMLPRGGAKLGDKTVLDALDAVAKATADGADPGRVAAAAVAAAAHALDRFRPLPCQIGRARIFADKSVGLDDPGMLGFVRLLEAIAASRTGGPK